MRPWIDNRDGSRYLRWPVRIKLASSRYGWWRIGWHGYEVGAEKVPDCKTSSGCVPGRRAVYARVLSIGPLRIVFGPRGDQERRTFLLGETCSCVSSYECRHRYHAMAARHAELCNREDAA
jgi:hypothetical protein